MPYISKNIGCDTLVSIYYYQYMITIIHRLLMYATIKPSLLSLKHLALALNSFDTLSDLRIKLFKHLF